MAILNNTQVVDRTTAIERIPFKNGLIGALDLYRTEQIRCYVLYLSDVVSIIRKLYSIATFVLRLKFCGIIPYLFFSSLAF